MNLSLKDKIVYVIWSMGIFLFLFLFFVKIHPMIVFDTDDWAYIYCNRSALPLWGNWNPSKIFPEVLMPWVSNLAVYVIYPFTHDYIQSLTIGHGLFTAGMIGGYILSFEKLLKEKYKFSLQQSMLYGTLFLVFHFLIFRKIYGGNQHLFYTSNVTCYYNYLLPAVFNCILVMYFMRKTNKDKNWEQTGWMKSGFLIVVIYFAVFSNLFSSVILVAYAGGNLLIHLAESIRKHNLSIKNFCRKEAWPILIVGMWIVAQIFEFSGGRAADVGTGSLGEDVISAFRCLISWVHKINFLFAAICILVCILFVGLIIRNRKDEEAHKIIRCCGRLVLYAMLTISYLVLLSAKVCAGYILRADVFIGIAFWGMLLLFTMLSYVLHRCPKMEILVPLLLVICICETNTSGNTFMDINMGGLPYETCKAIDDDIVEQIVEADENGLTEVKVYVPSFGTSDNWPIALYGGERMSDALSKHGMIRRGIYVELVPSEEKNEEFNLY